MDRKLMGKRINKARKDRGLTSENLAEMCSINATYLRQIESGARTPSLPLFVIICRQLKVSPSYLLADLLEDREIQEMDELVELWKTATPTQLRMITSIVKSALDSLKDERRDHD